MATADFFSTIGRVDWNLGRLRSRLDQLKLERNTILVFMTDNGGTGGVKIFNAGMRGRKGQVYDGGHRVPCFIHWPDGGLVGRHPDIAAQLKEAYGDYWAQVTPGDREFARPVVGTSHQEEIVLTGEELRPIEGHNACEWNQTHVAGGMAAFGYAEIEVARAGDYRFELRCWPREIEAPMAGVPSWTKPVDAWLHDRPVTAMLYGDKFRSLPVKRVRLKAGDQIHQAEVTPADTAKVFTLSLPAGPLRLETVMLDARGKPLAEAYYLYIRILKVLRDK